MAIVPILLLLVLFVTGFVNFFFPFPIKEFHAWIQSFFTKAPSPTSATAAAATRVATATAQQVSSPKETTSAYKKADLTRVFATFDKNGDGLIAKQELRDSLKNLRLSVTDKEVEEMVVKVDANGDGSIDFDEFCMLYEAMLGQKQRGGASGRDGKDGAVDQEEDDEEEDLKEAFDVFDKDKDGLISVEELGSVLSSLGLNEGRKIENCKEMIRKVDTDGDGMVNFDEFKRMMRDGGKLLSAF